VGLLEALLANRLEEVAGAVEVDAIALVEIGLGFARDDRREVENEGRPGTGESRRRGGGREIGGDCFDLARKLRPRRFHDMGKRQYLHGLAAHTAGIEKRLGELAA